MRAILSGTTILTVLALVTGCEAQKRWEQQQIAKYGCAYGCGLEAAAPMLMGAGANWMALGQPQSYQAPVVPRPVLTCTTHFGVTSCY